MKRNQQQQQPKAEAFKIVSRPSNEELKEEVDERGSTKWKKYPTAGDQELAKEDGEPIKPNEK